MTFARPDHTRDLETLPQMPAWVTSTRAETLEDVAFLSGAALSHLHLVLGHEEVPHALLRERLALRAAEACVGFSGRPERARELRDAVYLLRPGDLPGPAGETCLAWRRVVERPVSIKALGRALSDLAPDLDPDLATQTGQGTAPLARASATLGTALDRDPRADTAALILADATLSRALGWECLVPLLASGLKRADLRLRGDALRDACHRAIATAAPGAVRLAAELTRRSAHLRAVAPKLRAKGANAAVQIFLTRDAAAPAALPLPDRAARRLCDRLVTLGAVRELTGRDTFRLYGV
jgi:hypothetical protein